MAGLTCLQGRAGSRKSCAPSDQSTRIRPTGRLSWRRVYRYKAGRQISAEARAERLSAALGGVEARQQLEGRQGRRDAHRADRAGGSAAVISGAARLRIEPLRLTR
jgi:hypothetical protein